MSMLAAGLVLAACARGDELSSDTSRDNGEALAATVRRVPQGPAYTTMAALDSAGQVRGVVHLDGPPPADTVIHPAADQVVCGSGFTRRGIERRGAQAAGVIVWIEEIGRASCRERGGE